MDNPLPNRRFQVLDAMVLVAATAIGLGAGETLVRSHGMFPAVGTSYWAFSAAEVNRSLALSGSVTRAATWLGCVLISWALGLIVLWLRSPRPALRMLGARPGFAACLAVVANAFLLVARAWGDACFERRTFANWSLPVTAKVDYAGHFSSVIDPIAYAPVVAIVWIVLALTGAWKSEANWIDRAGRALGWLVIGSALALKILFWARA
jgi:hypothetical protein